jgi:hypothetical protein
MWANASGFAFRTMVSWPAFLVSSDRRSQPSAAFQIGLRAFGIAAEQKLEAAKRRRFACWYAIHSQLEDAATERAA